MKEIIEFVLKIIKEIPMVIKVLGVDIILILLIGFLTQIIKTAINKNRKKKIKDIIPILICLCIGFCIGLFQIIIFKPQIENWLRIIFGYPGGAVLAYEIKDRLYNLKLKCEDKK